MLRLVDAYHHSVPWMAKVKILIDNGWISADHSFLSSDYVFWTKDTLTLHYRASWLDTLPFDKFYHLVHDGDICSC